MPETVSKESEYMRHAIALAKNGEGRTNPNPLVGAVLVKNNEIIGEGFHQKYGGLHAEREALKNCEENGNSAEGATLYVTLEPCCHFGKQPPCTQAIVKSGIRRVVVGSRDPNPLVHGKGNSFLREQGIEVTEDFLKDECDALNPIFFHYISTRTPYVALKYAMTADGKTASKTGKSKWITGEKSRLFVHQLRNRYSCILAGIGTVLSDNPLLTSRIPGGRNPVRIICDSKLRIPLDCNIVQTAKEIPTIIACCQENEKKSALEKSGCEVLCLPGKTGVDLKKLTKTLGERSLDSVLIEGGSEIHYSALEAGIVQHIYAFTAPKIFGGKAKTPVEGEGIELPENCFQLELERIEKIGDDILAEYNVPQNAGGKTCTGEQPCLQE
ncbi:MAG: bifunctional diaminohydroxyphosphoribosylaminopyrimidine deaminase/5-amino-6-(5-phosphoribosylamino)uracil reductase RibD [Treponema porcinum]|uniref:bifunctional diaminohydroxyphosphoribosylaminopyrimidine deaminase/5-amino-6-(5-phosphoribosylamino)uracil reductase RibD n=1 Tax=Treponema porcinum TaxID=261392 RepID=UPI002A83C239|nr:bifunctional diaminohydroxyphosphoribosylaminopyrimidine deaminase/5-amino-6-(5-phosphoribosylamino)uracil reductase RibD [Treponema porcinum]MDY5048607.1 bifunctional diaminohydroxyphosphoribosylaminopyrimidine deaminase/5-amino-6-(5-phosphoribosylamino)uracil reductase RibD [Treponema porcinum]